MRQFKFPYLAFLPIPALIAIIAPLYLTVNISSFFEPPWLVLILNMLFVTAVFFTVAYLAMRNYIATGRIRFLFSARGVLTFGMGCPREDGK